MFYRQENTFYRSNMAASNTLPHRPGVPFVGQLFDIIRHGLYPTVCEHWLHHGDAFLLKVGGRKMGIFVHPDAAEAMLLSRRDDFSKGPMYDQIRLLVGDGVLTVEGERWRTQRRTIQPCMNHSFITSLVDTMVDASVGVVEQWEQRPAPLLDIYPEMMRLAMGILGRSLMSIDLSITADVSGQAFAVALKELSERGNALLIPPLWMPTPSNNRLRTALTALDDIVYGIIDARHAAKSRSDVVPSDLVSMLLDHRDAQGNPMPRTLIRDEIITMLLAGHETTALALTWTWYLLSANPTAEAQFHDELDRVLGGRLPTAEDVPRLEYTKQVFQESMRLMPPAWSNGRDVIRDTEICGYALPKGHMMLIVPYLTHRHPDFWERAEAFMPERFEPPKARGRHKYAYMPFSGGPRACMGNHFSMIEGVVAMAVIGQRFRMDLRPGHLVRTSPEITLRPDGGMPMLVHSRDRSPMVFDPQSSQPNAG